MVGGGVGSIVLPWLIGMSLDWFGIGLMLPLIALDVLLAGLVYSVLLLGWNEPVQDLRSLPTQ